MARLAPDKARIDVRDGKPRPEAKLGRMVLAWGSHFPLTPTDTAVAADATSTTLAARVIFRQAAARATSVGFSASRMSRPTSARRPGRGPA
jgi:hypothetical protein